MGNLHHQDRWSRRNEFNAEEHSKAWALADTTLALAQLKEPFGQLQLIKAQEHRCTRSVPTISHPHVHMERPELSAMLHQASSTKSETKEAVSLDSGLQVMTKFPFRGTHYLQSIFTEIAQEAVMSHIRWCAPIH